VASWAARRPRDFRAGDLPALPGRFWELVGPGAVLVGLSIGAGELIIWPRVTAEYGAAVAWAALLGIFIQLWLNLEIARYTLATGESIYTAFIRLSPAFAWVFLGLNFVGWIVPGWARTCGGALKVLLVGPNGWGGPVVWTAITFALVAFVLFGPRRVYSSVERTTAFLVVIITLGLVAVGVTVSSRETWTALGLGILNLPHKPAGLPAYELFSSIVFAGAGGTANLFYSFYIRDKGWGMGHHMPTVVNPLRGREERHSDTGFRIEATPANRQRWRQWYRHLVADQVIFFWLLNTFTIVLFILGALGVLHPRGIVPNQELLVWEEASILGEHWGLAGRYLFLLVGVACLFSTQLTLVDGVARSCADILHTAFPWARTAPVSTWYARIATFWIAAGIGLTYAYENLPAIVFLLSAGFFGGIAMAIYGPLTLIANRRLLPRGVRPGAAMTAMTAAVSLFYVAFALVSVFVLIQRVVAG
jgi:Mn2+/Fe2+ NRAMP family transporter